MKRLLPVFALIMMLGLTACQQPSGDAMMEKEGDAMMEDKMMKEDGAMMEKDGEAMMEKEQ